MKIKFTIIFLIFTMFISLDSQVLADKDATKIKSSISEKYGFSFEEEKEIGLQSALLMIKRFSLYDNPQVVNYVRQIGEQIAKKNSKRPEIQYNFFVLNTKQINAYAVPGGYIFLTKGLLNTLENEAELAGIISHEITHVEMGHGLEAISKDSEAREKIRIIKTNLDAGNALIQQSNNNSTQKESNIVSGLVNSGNLKAINETIKFDKNGNINIVPD